MGMVALTIRQGTASRVQRLGQGVFLIGRQAGCDIVLDDGQVSRRHARLVVDGAEVIIEDLGGGNGTFIQGQSVGAALIAPGQVVEISPFLLSWEPLVERGPRFALEVVDGPGAGAQHPIAPGEPRTFGRAEDQDVRLADNSVSRKQGTITAGEQGVHVVLESGTAVFRGFEVREAVLLPGETLTVGLSTLRLRDLEA
jgi:pSer/pThr/pTyr-binding forkhead associated (FHA) protein